MIAHKYTTRVIAVVMALAVCLCLLAVAFSNEIVTAAGDTGVSMEYETKLFDTQSIISVNIIMDEDDWNDMLENAMSEEYYQCDVEVNGEMFYQVAIRPKGNTSLSSIANDPTTDRYSFKLEFDHYVEGQTCFGLDKLILNNNYADATNMKEALIYDMYQYLGADASLYNYAKISVNDEYWGVYLALEAVEDSFLLRNYGVQTGALYKPESMGMGGNGSQGGNGGFSMGGSGADLNYSDDDLDSYSTIWDGEITSTTDLDHKRVVKALKNISEGTDLESYMDIDNLLRYMAVHVFSVNEDSLSGMMAHNYYLYESGGKLNLIPWDYNLCLGGMGNGNDASSVINSTIDNAFSATDFFDTLMENETYHNQYYEYLQQLVDEYINGGGFDAFYERVRSQIDELVESDPTAFYSYEDYQTAADMLYQVVKSRGESIQGQIDGTIPSTEEEQRTNAEALVDTSGIDLSVMGSMNTGGGGMGDKPDDMAGDGESMGDKPDGTPENMPDGAPENMPDGASGGMPDGNMPQFDGEDSEGASAESLSEDTMNQETAEEAAGIATENTTEDTAEDTAENVQSSEEETTEASAGEAVMDFSPGGKSMGDFSGSFEGFDMKNHDENGAENGSTSTVQKDTLILYGVTLLVLLAAMTFAKLYKRK